MDMARATIVIALSAALASTSRGSVTPVELPILPSLVVVIPHLRFDYVITRVLTSRASESRHAGLLLWCEKPAMEDPRWPCSRC